MRLAQCHFMRLAQCHPMDSFEDLLLQVAVAAARAAAAQSDEGTRLAFADTASRMAALVRPTFPPAGLTDTELALAVFVDTCEGWSGTRVWGQ